MAEFFRARDPVTGEEMFFRMNPRTMVVTHVKPEEAIDDDLFIPQVMTYIGKEVKEGWVRVMCMECGSSGQVHPDIFADLSESEKKEIQIGLCPDCQKKARND